MRSLLLLVVVLGGCYFSYPSLPKGSIKLVPGATAEIPRDAGDIDKDCGKNDSGSCKGKLTHRVHVVTGEPTYNGQKVSHYQFRMLVDADFRTKVAHIRDLKSTCNISIAPTILAGVAAGVALYIGNEKGEHYSRNAGIAVGIGAGFYALSYPLGGYACTRARREWHATGMDSNAGEAFVYISDDKDEAYLEGLQELARKFNTNPGGAGAVTPPESETPSAPSAPPDSSTSTQPSVAAGTKNIVGAMKAQGGYLAFLTIVECAGKEAELASGNFTVLAFDDETVRKKVKSDKDRKKFKDNCVKIYNAHVATDALPASAFKVGEMVEVHTLDGTSHLMKVREGHRVIEATNGMIYTLDEVLSGWR
jgi:hypothetical protein